MPEEREQARSVRERAYADAIERAHEVDETRARLLDAAFELFCRLGIQRTPMEEVTRKFATKDRLVEQLILRELRRYFAQFLDDIAQAETAGDRVVANPLIGGLPKTESTSVVGSMIGDNGGMVATVREFVAGRLRREQPAGTIAADLDSDLVAELMVRISASFLTVPSRIVDISDDARLAPAARQFLVPMLEPRR